MAYQMAQTPVTLNDLEGHSSVSELFKCKSSTFVQLFTRCQLACPCRAVPQRQLGFLLVMSEKLKFHDNFWTYLTLTLIGGTVVVVVVVVLGSSVVVDLKMTLRDSSQMMSCIVKVLTHGLPEVRLDHFGAKWGFSG